MIRWVSVLLDDEGKNGETGSAGMLFGVMCVNFLVNT